MSRLVSIVVLIIGVVYGVSAQQAVAGEGAGGIYLLRSEADIDNSFKRGYYVGPHVLGDTITALMNKFENLYVYYKPSSGAYKTEEKVVLKPNIYLKVKKVEKAIRKDLKKDRINEGEAYEDLKQVLTTGIKLMNYRTDEVEMKLDKMKDTDEIIEYLGSLKYRS